jgi:transcriptional regulator with XRE-family HTH domain
MEFNEKLQELRRQKGITQEELAERIYVSRTAISKWESGRGYPNIESLKALAKFFSVTVDQLLSADELITLAEEDGKQKETRFLDLLFGLLDLSMALLLFLPFFASVIDGTVQGASLLALNGVRAYLKTAYYAAVFGSVSVGVLILAMQGCRMPLWTKIKACFSLGLGAVSVLVFVISSQPYAAVFAFVLVAIKALMLIKRR